MGSKHLFVVRLVETSNESKCPFVLPRENSNNQVCSTSVIVCVLCINCDTCLCKFVTGIIFFSSIYCCTAMIQFLREDELLSEDVVRANWRRGYRALFGDYDSFGFLEEDYTAVHRENVNRAQEAYRTLQHSVNRNGGRYECARLPFKINIGNNTPREVPYLNALPIMRERNNFRPISRTENMLTVTVPQLLEFDLVHLDAAYRKYRGIGHKVKVGPMVMRRVIRYEDLILARIYQELDYHYIMDINFRETYTMPQLYCRHCQIIMFEQLRESNHCALCNFTKCCRFSSNIFEMRAHYQACPGDQEVLNLNYRDSWNTVVEWMTDVGFDSDNDGFASLTSSDHGYSDNE